MSLKNKVVGIFSIFLAPLLTMMVPGTVYAQNESAPSQTIPHFSEQAVVAAWKQVHRRAKTYAGVSVIVYDYTLEVSDKTVQESSHGFTAPWHIDEAWYVSVKDDPDEGQYGSLAVGLKVSQKTEPADHFGELGFGLGTYYIFSYPLFDPIEKISSETYAVQESYFEKIFCNGGSTVTEFGERYPKIQLEDPNFAIAKPYSFADTYGYGTFSMGMNCSDR